MLQKVAGLANSIVNIQVKLMQYNKLWSVEASEVMRLQALEPLSLESESEAFGFR